MAKNNPIRYKALWMKFIYLNAGCLQNDCIINPPPQIYTNANIIYAKIMFFR